MPVITKARLREIEKLERELCDLKYEKWIKPFVDKLINNLGTLAANTPRDKWPKEFELAFEAARKEMPSLAEIYLEMLPKK